MDHFGSRHCGCDRPYYDHTVHQKRCCPSEIAAEVDYSSHEDYYRYEIRHENGSREVILIGGTPDNYGWWGLLFDAEGKYCWNHGNIPESESDPVWQYKGCFDEGVPSGNPEYDDLLKQKN